eukprot:428953-Prymnesium_polylepis.1
MRSGCGVLACSGVKGSLGHGESTAGATGLLKLVLSLWCAQPVANPQLRVLNPHIGSALRSAKVVLPSQRAVLVSASAPVGGVSSFGYSGTIAHAALVSAWGDGRAGGTGGACKSDFAAVMSAQRLVYVRQSFGW